jgi:hypothetical protein
VAHDGDAPLPPEEPFSGEEASDEIIDPVARFRHTGAGVEDTDIVGDVGPTDIPPGAGSDGGLLADEEDGEAGEAG